METKPRQLTPLERAGVERTFRNEYLRRVKAGENEPFASLMAYRAHAMEFNRLRFSDPPGAK
jgi:hypothetical protein